MTKTPKVKPTNSLQYEKVIKDLEFIIKLQELHIKQVEYERLIYFNAHIESWKHNVLWKEEYNNLNTVYENILSFHRFFESDLKKKKGKSVKKKKGKIK
jgi:hypothetical protein